MAGEDLPLVKQDDVKSHEAIVIGKIALFDDNQVWNSLDIVQFFRTSSEERAREYREKMSHTELHLRQVNQAFTAKKAEIAKSNLPREKKIPLIERLNTIKEEFDRRIAELQDFIDQYKEKLDKVISSKRSSIESQILKQIQLIRKKQGIVLVIVRGAVYDHDQHQIKDITQDIITACNEKIKAVNVNFPKIDTKFLTQFNMKVNNLMEDLNKMELRQ